MFKWQQLPFIDLIIYEQKLSYMYPVEFSMKKNNITLDQGYMSRDVRKPVFGVSDQV